MTTVRWPLRLRLTLLYGTAFFAAGAVLLAVNYALVRHNLEQQISQIAVPVGPNGPLVPANLREITQQLSEYQDRVRQEALNSLLRQSIVALIAVGVVAVAMGYGMAANALRPLQSITSTARRVAGSNLTERINLQGPHDEIKELADTFDGMLARLEHSFASQQRFVAHASHELRTPLSLNRAVLEVAMSNPDASGDLRETGEKLLEVNRRSEELIEGLLVLARSERELTERHPVDLVAVCEHALDQWEAAYEKAGVELRLHLSPISAWGSAVLLERLVANLLQNAVRHNIGPGGTADLATYREGPWAVIEMTNTGAPIPHGEVTRLFEPFQSLSGERVRGKGVGLGLSIVRAIAQTHGGHIGAFPREGGGLTVRARVPLSYADEPGAAPEAGPSAQPVFHAPAPVPQVGPRSWSGAPHGMAGPDRSA